MNRGTITILIGCTCLDWAAFDRGKGPPFLALVMSSADPHFKSPVLTFRQIIQTKLPRFPELVTPTTLEPSGIVSLPR